MLRAFPNWEQLQVKIRFPIRELIFKYIESQESKHIRMGKFFSKAACVYLD